MYPGRQDECCLLACIIFLCTFLISYVSALIIRNSDGTVKMALMWSMARRFSSSAVQQLAEDDKHRQMADKVLRLLWELARDPDLLLDVMELAHVSD